MILLSEQQMPLLIILGPTAAGKTDLSITLALKYTGEIISADSMQVYKYMDIGTAKASTEERALVKHHLLDIINPDQNFSVAEYKELVDNLVPEIIERNSLPIMVGGTGLYIQSVLKGFLFPEMETDENLRRDLNEEAAKHGNEFVHKKLAKVDLELAEKLHPNDLRRVIRGIEVYKQTGKTISYFKHKQQNTPSKYNYLKIGLTRDREDLYNRINKRVGKMINGGLIEEVQGLLDRGYNLSHTAMQGLGYKELLDYLNGKYDLQEAIRVLKRDTRHFAKRQLTWFNRDKEINWFNLTKLAKNTALDQISKLIDKKIVN